MELNLITKLMNPKSPLRHSAFITIKKGEARLLKIMTTNFEVNPDKRHRNIKIK